jgi:hypothetical protein
MSSLPLELHGSFTDDSLLADSADGLSRVGLAGLLDGRGRRAYRARLRGAATVGYRWGLVDTFTSTWWPQGIATGQHRGSPVIITSWFAQARRGKKMGSRISIIDLRDRARPRYHHVLLVEPKRRDGTVVDGTAVDGTVVFEPVEVHAGGIVWTGDRLLVAATHGGIREFHLGDILRTPTAGVLRRPTGLFGYRHLLPQAGVFSPPNDHQGKGMRYSFLSLESGNDPSGVTDPAAPTSPTDTDPAAPASTTNSDPAAPASTTNSDPAAPASPTNIDPAAPTSPTRTTPPARQAARQHTVRLITGEYSKNEKGRLGRLHLTGDRSAVNDVHVPQILEMQGAVVHNGVWFVNASRGDTSGGDLWVGTPGKMIRHAGVLPPGPEDNAVLAESNEIWSVTEFPRKRWIYAIDLRRWS